MGVPKNQENIQIMVDKGAVVKENGGNVDGKGNDVIMGVGTYKESVLIAGGIIREGYADVEDGELIVGDPKRKRLGLTIGPNKTEQEGPKHTSGVVEMNRKNGILVGSAGQARRKPCVA